MRRATCVGLASVAAVASATLAAGDRTPSQVALAQEPRPQPNVIVVMTDDQDARSMAVMEGVQRKLVAQGTTFTNFFATFPLCCPSRATFLTGQYAHNHHVLSNIPPDGGDEAFTGADTAMPVALQGAGYRTALIGKYFNGFRLDDPRPPGWDVWRAADGGASSSYGYRLRLGDGIVHYGSEPHDYRTSVYTRLAVRYIDQSHELGDPFFLTVALGVPHVEGRDLPPEPGPDYDGRFDDEPLPMPESFNEPDVSDKPPFLQRPLLSETKVAAITELHRARLASLLPVDDLVERVLGTLRRTGELANTYVIFTSDNGFMLGEHRLKNKTRLYEESVRVPMVMRGPGVPAGATVDHLTGNVDLAPTILDAADATPLSEPDGRSLLPLAADPSIEWRQEVLLENRVSQALRTPTHMYAEHQGGTVELYDLAKDPLQLTSLHADPDEQALIDALSERLSEVRFCAGDNCP
jgi:arylsulfatase A-like enzyme